MSTVYTNKDPIIARASAAGFGGIGIIRLSGAPEKMTGMLERLFPGKKVEPRHAHLFALNDAQALLIDRTIVLHFPAPASYTGESVVEIQAHGGPAVLQMIIDRCMEVGADLGLRQAQPGEFSERAFLNGRMDLVQAEAVADLIEASSQAAARAAARSMQGAFSHEVHRINQDLLELRAYIEATIDFPEEEVDFIEDGHVNERVDAIAGELEALSRNAMRGKVLRDGLTVVLVGSPNVGKSSLMNALAREDVAIVTDIAGTTRDKIDHMINLDGFSMNLIDTAGVRHTEDKVEQIGIERTLKAVENADVVVHLTSADQKDQAGEQEAMELIRPRLREGVVFVRVMNKVDLVESSVVAAVGDDGVIAISARTGKGMDVLIEKLKKIAGMSGEVQGEFLARTRHLECIARALEHVNAIRGGVGVRIGLEIAAEELRLAGQALGEIVGETVADDLLGMIFSKFCIGK